MNMRSSIAALIVLAVVSSALGNTPRLLGEPQGAKQDVKSAGHDTEQAAKKTDTAVEQTSKKAAHESAQAAKTTGKAVEDSTNKATHTSVHGLKKTTKKVEGKTAAQ